MGWLISFLQNPIALIFVVGLLGILIGMIGTKRIKLGASAALLVGLAFGHFGFSVPMDFFNLGITLFMAAVGLLASKDVVRFLRLYGIKIPALSIMITLAGAITIYVLNLIFKAQANPSLIAGAYTGALTSSPGLAAALEVTSSEPLTVIGYTLVYPLGMLTVVFFIQLIPKIAGINVGEERTIFRREFKETGEESNNGAKEVAFSVFIYFLVIVIGLLVGEIPIPLPYVGSFNLGAAGGVLIAALIIGYCGQRIGHIGAVPVGIAQTPLRAIRDMVLPFALGAIGLRAGMGFVNSIMEYGIILMLIGIVTAIVAITVGFLVGRYIFHINWTVLSGALCGGMTSTPGLAIAIDSVKAEEAGIGYGAAYPLALICMVTFTKLLHIFV